MEQAYEVRIDVRVNKRLTQDQQDDLREAMLKALDNARLPFKADVVTADVKKG